MSGRGAVAVLGASGLIGSHLLRVGGERRAQVVGTAHRQSVPGLHPLDLTDADAVTVFLRALRPRTIFVAAANPNVELCEAEPEATRRVNVAPLEPIARVAAEVGAALVYYSSDYVFDGRSGPYVETDPPSPISEYGRQKLEAEEVIRSVLPDDTLILRVTVVYGAERQGKNFLARLVRTLRAGEALPVPADQVGSPTLADDVAEASWSLAETGARGTYHLAGPDLMDRYEFARRAASAFGLDPALLRPVTTAELGQRAPRPLRAGMISRRAEAALGRGMLGVAEGLHRARERLTT